MDYDRLDTAYLAEALKNRKVLVFRLMLDLKIFLANLKIRIFKKFSFKKRSFAISNVNVTVEDPFKKLMRQTMSFGGSLLIVMSFAAHGPETGFTAEYYGDTDYIDVDLEEEADMPFLMNDEGFILKSSPATEETNRIGFNTNIKHTVESGDTLSGIAALYGISTRTLLWENNLSDSSTLRIGQTLLIPSIDGVSYVVSSKDTLDSVAKSFGVDAKLIAEHNKLEGDVIGNGQKIFIPGGKKKEEPKPVIAQTRSGTRSGGRTYTANTFDAKIVVASNDKPGSGKVLIFPTTGDITQRFHAGHYAIDIGNSGQPDIWAAAAGTVITSKGGCPERSVRVERSCNGGYGNYVEVDHGNGLVTLYAHMQTLYVSEGQGVGSGQALGKMGNSGRTYGPTGIHLHLEVRDGGVKKNPQNYF